MTAEITYERRGDYLSQPLYGVLLHGRLLGEVYRITQSTDTRLAGTRLRRVGRGRPGWRARAPVGVGGATHTDRELVRGIRDYRLEGTGHTYDRREDAARALIAWNSEQGLKAAVLYLLMEDRS